MINLIPPHGQTALKHEYVLRVASVYAFIFGGILLASIALMVPTYVLITAQLKAVQNDSPDMEATRATFETAAGEIKTANAVMSQLRFNEKELSYAKIVEEIVTRAPDGITFSTFQAAQSNGVIAQITVQGFSRTRNALASFKNQLEASPLFETAMIPISDLARDTNLPFVVTISMKKAVIAP